MARCPNCARRVRFWRNHGGYCSRQCRTESITSCPNCGKVGLFKHARLGCCGEECRFWYVANLLGYDKDALVTPGWDKIVYHVRLPSTSAEISSLQFDELEYDRAADTVLVIAAPPWMTRPKVLAELPYERFDSPAWQHLWADGTLTEDELFRFHRVCYDDDLLCQKLGEHVYAKLRQPGQVYHAASPPAGQLEAPPLSLPAPTLQMEEPRGRIAAPTVPPDEFLASVRVIFEGRGFSVSPGASGHTFLLQRNGRPAMAAYYYRTGLIDVDQVQHAFALSLSVGATSSFVVTSGHFTLQAEDFAAAKSIQLIDGDEMAELAALTRDHEIQTARVGAELTPVLSFRLTGNGATANGDHAPIAADVSPIRDAADVTAQISIVGQAAPVDGELVGGDDGTDNAG